MLSFPDMNKARGWYKSPAYQKILHLRTAHLVDDVILVEGVAPGHTPAKFAEKIREMLARAPGVGSRRHVSSETRFHKHHAPPARPCWSGKMIILCLPMEES